MPNYLTKRINNNIKQINHLIKIIFIIAVYSSCFLSGTLYSITTSATFERITKKDGLSQSTVTNIIQDRKGFMWFGTYDGMNKYDGYTFKTYRHIENDNSSLSDNGAAYLYEDNKGFIWVTNNANEGICKFNPETEKFIRYKHNPDDSTSISSNTVYHIMQDSRNNIWISTNNALNLLIENKIGDKITESFKRFDISSIEGRLTKIHENRNGKLLLFANYVYYFDRESNTIKRASKIIEPANATYAIISISEDKAGNLWLGTIDSGIIKLVYDKQTQSYKQAVLNKSIATLNGRNYVLIDYKNRIWIATNKNGLFQYSEKEDRLINFSNDKTDLNSISDNSIISLFIDRSGILWIGTYSQGLCKYDLFKKQFYHFKSIPGNNNTLGGNVISSIHSTTPGELWIGLDKGGGVNRLIFRNNKDPKVTHYKYSSTDNNTIGDNNTLCLVQRKNGEVWLGSASNSLSKIVPEKTGTNESPIIKRYLQGSWTFSIYEDSQGTIWGGTWGGGLWKYKDKTNTFVYFRNDPDDSTSLCDNIIWAIAEDNTGNLWIGGHGKGLSILPAKEKDKLNPKFINFKHEEENDESLSSNTINVFCQDHTGTMWIGTAGGLNKVVKKDNNLTKNKLSFISYHIKDGLPAEGIIGIIEDNNGNLWLSTSNGLSKFNVSELSFTNYTESDGLQSNEFWHNSYFKDQNGRIYFGGNNGLNAFYPDSIKPNPFIPDIVITDIKLFNKSVEIGEEIDGDVIISKSINETSKIVLSYKNNMLSLEFAALHYTGSENSKYAYKMEGFDKEWIKTSADRRFATYSNLPAGKYTFKVKASNCDGVWNEEGTLLKIIITPPFWKTIWSRLSTILLIITVTYTIYRIRVRSIVAYGRRFKELADALEKSNEELKQFAHIIAHDLKVPLRGVNQLAEWISDDYSDVLDKKGKTNLKLLKKRTKFMNDIIQALLDYSKIGKAKSKIEHIDFNNLLENVIHSISPPPNVKIIIENKLPKYRGDSTLLSQIFENLISNAIKYTDKSVVIIKINCTDENNKWKFSISDNGPGIEEKYFDKIFQMFETLDHKKTYRSTGIGLTIAKKIVEAEEGKIWIESEIGKGTIFYFTLPKSKNMEKI